MPEIIASKFCPPGTAYLIERDALNIDGGQLVVVHDETTKLSIEEAIERQSASLRRMCALMGVSFQDTNMPTGPVACG